MNLMSMSFESGNASSTTISLQWIPPAADTIHGELLGYKIIVHARDRPQADRSIILPDSKLRVNKLAISIYLNTGEHSNLRIYKQLLT